MVRAAFFLTLTIPAPCRVTRRRGFMQSIPKSKLPRPDQFARGAFKTGDSACTTVWFVRLFPRETLKRDFDTLAARWHDAADELSLPRSSVPGVSHRQDMPGVTGEQLSACFRLMLEKLGIAIT